MSIEYYDPEAANAKATHPGIQKSLTNGKVNGSVDGNDSSGECEDKDLSKTNNNNNPNKRYLECPGSVKVQHLKKFITMKYELSEDFLVSKKVKSFLFFPMKLNPKTCSVTYNIINFTDFRLMSSTNMT